MRLLNAETCKLEHFPGRKIPRYAILSHTWDDLEITLQDLARPGVEDEVAYGKIRLTCAQTLRDGLQYAWIDTCCIDKTSSAELSEAINSMWRWYSRAAKCYAYLSDVTTEPVVVESHDAQEASDSAPLLSEPLLEQGVELQRLDCEGTQSATSSFEYQFRHSRWFTRGWTLQELIAPSDVVFYNASWTLLGTRNTNLSSAICDITRIEKRVLANPANVRASCVAKRMSWAAHRQTTRIEDEAYCLLGIFGINMPLLYGEGEQAFIRLQEMILKNGEDLSILAWEDENNADLLASSPAMFRTCVDYEVSKTLLKNEPVLSSRGLRMTALIGQSSSGTQYVVLNCRQGTRELGLRIQDPYMVTSTTTIERSMNPGPGRLIQFYRSGKRLGTPTSLVISRSTSKRTRIPQSQPCFLVRVSGLSAGTFHWLYYRGEPDASTQICRPYWVKEGQYYTFVIPSAQGTCVGGLAFEAQPCPEPVLVCISCVPTNRSCLPLLELSLDTAGGLIEKCYALARAGPLSPPSHPWAMTSKSLDFSDGSRLEVDLRRLDNPGYESATSMMNMDLCLRLSSRSPTTNSNHNLNVEAAELFVPVPSPAQRRTTATSNLLVYGLCFIITLFVFLFFWSLF